MTAIWSLLVAAAVFCALVAFGDLVSEEIRGRLDRLPRTLLVLAARRVPASLRDELLEEWEGELHEILRGAEALPVTRLVKGTRYGLGLWWAAPRVGRLLDRLVRRRARQSRLANVRRLLASVGDASGMPNGGQIVRVRVTVDRRVADWVARWHHFDGGSASSGGPDGST